MPTSFPLRSPSPLVRRDPRPALIRGAIPVAARPDPLSIVIIAITVRAHAHALAAHADNRRGRADQDLPVAFGRDAAGERDDGPRGGREVALRVRVVVGRVDDVDREVGVVCEIGELRWSVRVVITGMIVSLFFVCVRGCVGKQEGGLTGLVDAAVSWEGEGVLGRAGVEGQMDGLHVLTLLEGNGRDTGHEAEVRSEDVEVLHDG